MSTSTPGVYVQEVPSGGRAVEPSATSVTAFVGRARRGPVDRAVPVRSVAEFERTFGGLWEGSGLGYAVRAFFANGGTDAVVVRVDDGGVTAEVDLGGGLVVEAIGPGEWASSMVVGVSHPSAAEAAAAAQAQGVGDPDAVFTFWVELDGRTEVFAHVTSVNGPRRVDTVLESSALVRARAAFPLARPTAGSFPVTTAGAEGTTPGSDAYLSESHGIRALDAVPTVNLLVLPPVTRDQSLPDEVWPEALAYVRERRAFLLVDPPPSLAWDEVAGWLADVGLSGRGGRDAAVYYPRLNGTDPLDGAARAIAPSGAVAGVYARTDASRGVWKAPAGTDAGVRDVAGPAAALADSQSGVLNPLGINAIRSFPGFGTVVWGSRTLAGSDALGDEYKYVPVRRLALHIEESLQRGLAWAVFEPNDEPLWAQLRLSVGAFLHDLFRRGAFAGQRAEEAFFVRCDRSTMSQVDIDSGWTTLLVGFAPLKPAEFVILRIRQRTASR
ncbi:phage tail sheath family protein [Nostocoides sp. F2B08]|uniref:phage tail sheath family protein n=1 Tax=Nostocoides sp. F2B08 TaxID=2653936 RepID=UPI001263CAC0|nr:phage tail sheath subtilisin-like domain-containing protein [Tetrasphaera sp. F2B08]KAB7744107.1 phage tail sheath family protein [Tetrasphaera sp. F2B08]